MLKPVSYNDPEPVSTATPQSIPTNRFPNRFVKYQLQFEDVFAAWPWRAVLRALPADVPWAIEYPLAGDGLAAATRAGIEHLRALAATRSGESA